MKKQKFLAFTMIASLTFTPLATNAHSGRTDKNGGHRDNKNVSGLGSYHYHCNGNGPHLHTNGCPYSKTKANKNKVSSKKKSNNSNLKSAQEKLNSLGYDCGKADGVMGKKTKSAIKSFQKSKGLKQDGVLGKNTIKALKI